jgi:ABC-type transporter Mla subunit MlaD
MKQGGSMASEKSVKEKAAQVLSDLEKTSEAILTELAAQYSKVKQKAGEIAETVSEKAVKTTHDIKEKVTGDETKEQLRSLIQQVEESSKSARLRFTERMEDLSQRVANAIESLKTPTKPAKKKSAAKKKASRPKANKKQTKKKQSVKKKSDSKKTAKKTPAKRTAR